MNELIEELTKQIQEGKINFGAGILFACEAQRNACVRAYNKHYGDSEHYDECCELEIFTSQIQRRDYE